MTGIDIILPAYHPPAGWEDTVISRFISLQKALAINDLGLIIVNDGTASLNGSPSPARIASAVPQMQWVSYDINRGKGHALREGVRRSGAGIIIYTDIDWPYTEESMVRIVRELMLGADVAVGTRDDTYYAHLPPARKRISRLLRKINARVLRLNVDDTQAGLKGFRASVKDIFLSATINRYLFDLEFIYRLSREKQIRMTGVPVTLREGIVFSKMNRKILLQEGINFLKIVLGGEK